MSQLKPQLTWGFSAFRAARDGAGIHGPFRKDPDLPGDIGIGNESHNKLLRALRFPAERAMAMLKQRRRTLQYVTLSPDRIGAITQAPLARAARGTG